MRLDWNNLLSKERLNAKTYPDNNDFDIRSEYQRDIDRILFSSAFRRLQDKTQVMPLAQNDYVRNRLTHTLEVSSVGRCLGKLAGNFILSYENNLNGKYVPDDFANVVVAACLAHDLGNPPFGHFGEYSIGKYFKSYYESKPKVQLDDSQWEDLKQYEGNAEGLRIMTSNSLNRMDGGMRLTFATLGAFSKYTCTSIRKELTEFGMTHYARVNENKEVHFNKTLSKVGIFQTEKHIFKEIASKQGLVKLTKDGSDNLAWCRNPLAFIMEAADTITYHIVDLEDGYKMGIVKYEEAEYLFYTILKNTHDPRCDINDWQKLKNNDDKIGSLRSKALNSLIHESFQVFKENYELMMYGMFDKEIADCIKSAELLNNIKDNFTKDKIFSHSSVIDLEIAGFKVINGLLEVLVSAVENPDDRYSKRIIEKMPKTYSSILGSRISDYEKLLTCANYVSRMTDSYALQQYRIISGESIY